MIEGSVEPVARGSDGWRVEGNLAREKWTMDVEATRRARRTKSTLAMVSEMWKTGWFIWLIYFLHYNTIYTVIQITALTQRMHPASTYNRNTYISHTTHTNEGGFLHPHIIVIHTYRITHPKKASYILHEPNAQHIQEPYIRNMRIF